MYHLTLLATQGSIEYWGIIVSGVIATATAAVGIISRAQIKNARSALELVLIRADENERQLRLAQSELVDLRSQVKSLQDGFIESVGMHVAEVVLKEIRPHLNGESHGNF